MEKNNQKVWWIILIVGAICLLVGGFLVNKSDSNETAKPKLMKVELNKQYKESIKAGSSISFKYTPEESGYYYYDWSSNGDENAAVEFSVLKNNKEAIEAEGEETKFFIYLENGNDYYFKNHTENDVTISFEMGKFAEGNITDGEEVTINKNTVLFYEGKETETKQLTLSDDSAARVMVFHPDNYSVGYSYVMKGLFDVKAGLKYNFYCYDVKGDVKVLVKKAPAGIIIE